MPIIYTPRGKALEYSDLAANLYTGCRYVFLGKELGGKRQEDDETVLTLPIFQEGCERLLREAVGNRIVLLCSEKDPAKCHRTYWISRALCHRLQIRHILADGSTVTHEELITASKCPDGR